CRPPIPAGLDRPGRGCPRRRSSAHRSRGVLKGCFPRRRSLEDVAAVQTQTHDRRVPAPGGGRRGRLGVRGQGVGTRRRGGGGGRGDEVAPRTEEEPARTARATNRPTEAREAEFVFRGAARGRKAVALVVAGTSAPVLCLPVTEDLRVVVGGRQVGIDALRAGT